MGIADDISVAANGDIRHAAGTDNYRVLELHRFLQDLADDAIASGDDLLDITSPDPSARSTDNIITLLGNYNIDDDLAKYLYDGSIVQGTGASEVMYAGLEIVGSLFGTTTLQVVQNNALYDTDSPFWGTGINVDATANILCRMLIKVKIAGADIDRKKIRVFAREWGHTYAEFSVTMGLGVSIAAIFTNEDLNNKTAQGTVAGWTTIVNTEGYQMLDLGNGNGAQPYYSKWDKAAYTLNQMYERCKYITRRGSSETIHGMKGELFRGITRQWDYDGESGGPFAENEILSWGSGTTAGTGILLALDDNGSTGVMWIQLLTGVVPSDPMTITGGSSSATCEINGSVTSRSVPSMFLGSTTGTNIIGAFGIGIDPNDLGASDKLTDLLNVLQVPPNNVTFTVFGLVSGEDRVLVGLKAAGDDFAFDQLTLATSLTGAAETSVVVTGAIPSDTAQTGTIRIELNSGIHKRVSYTSWTGSTFTIGSTNFSGDNASQPTNVMVSYIDKLAGATSESFTVVYASDRDLFVRVRDGGTTPIKTFESPASLGAAGGSSTAIRTSDS